MFYLSEPFAMPTVVVCFSPALYPYLDKGDDLITVVIDVLRATTSFCTAFDYGVREIIPVNSLETAMVHKENGHLVAAERDGVKPAFADYSNSAFDFMNNAIVGKSIYYTTTNGTRAIELATVAGKVAIASFLNIPAITRWLIAQNSNVILLCAGWKNNFCIEDTLCAGAIAKSLIQDNRFELADDSALTSVTLWNTCNEHLETMIRRSSHFNRLKKLGYDDVLSYSLQIGKSNAVPVMQGNSIVNLSNAKNNKTV